MASDYAIMFNAALSLPLNERIPELTQLFHQPVPFKDLHLLFPQLIEDIFGSNNGPGWGLLMSNTDCNTYECDMIQHFLSPQGPMFDICYKQLLEPQFKYDIPLHLLPYELQEMFQRGRYPQFYADLVSFNPDTMQVMSLTLNPFAYYIYHFALHLLNNNTSKYGWENWNTAYFQLVCDYLTHFLPSDPNVQVTPVVMYNMEKTSTMTHSPNRNRSNKVPLLIIKESLGMTAQHQSCIGNTSTSEVWRSETLIYAFSNIWLSVNTFSTMPFSTNPYPMSNYTQSTASTNRVRIARVLVKQVHMYSSSAAVDPNPSVSSLKRRASQLICHAGYHYVKELVTLWPLDASFRLVLELWLSLIQPWRYAGMESLRLHNSPYRRHGTERNEMRIVDLSYMHFIAENILLYSDIFQQIMPRFMRLDFMVPKNALMLFRLSKVFSQPNLVDMIRNIENAIMLQKDLTAVLRQNVDCGSNIDWGRIAADSISELTGTYNYNYKPMMSEHCRENVILLLKKAASDKIQSENMIKSCQKAVKNSSFYDSVLSFLKFWTWDSCEAEESKIIEKQKVPFYLGTFIQQMTQIFMLDDLMLMVDHSFNESHSENSSFVDSSRYGDTVSSRIRNTSTNINYMGDPDLMPITTYENTFLVRLLYQITSKINQTYEDKMWQLWRRTDFLGNIVKECLLKPCTVYTYTKGGTSYRNIVPQNLPPRISLRKLGTHSCIMWFIFVYLIFRYIGYTCLTCVFFFIFIWFLIIFTKASLKTLGIMKPNNIELN